MRRILFKKNKFISLAISEMCDYGKKYARKKHKALNFIIPAAF